VHDAADVIVLGAGVAGLLVAGELAQRHRVLVLEKANRVPETKYWLTDAGCVDANSHLAQAIDSNYSNIAFIAHDDLTYHCFGAYRLWDTSRLLSTLRTRLEEAGGEIRCGTSFYSYSVDRHSALVRANDERISARLIVDCMGVASPIVAAEDAMRIDGYYLLYGASFPRTTDIAPVAFHNLMLSDHPSYIEAFPTSDDRLHMILISPVEKLTAASSLRADFEFICTKSPYARYIDSAASRERRFLGGVIPVGRMMRRALDRVVFFGEAGQTNPPASATALTKMLYHYSSFCESVSRCLDAGTCDAASLSAAVKPVVDLLNAAVQRSLFRAMLRWRSRHFHAIVDDLVRLNDHRFANDMIFATITPRSVIPYARGLLRARAYTLLSTLGSAAIPPFTGRAT